VRTEATFKSGTFNTSEAKPYFINPECYGDDLAKWMIERLRAAGYKTADEPGQEDFGWYFDFEVPAGPHCVVLGYQPDDPEGQWVLTLERSRGLVGSLFGRRNKGIDDAAVQAINRILAAPEIRDLQWQGQ
jgi:hypothetical protein